MSELLVLIDHSEGKPRKVSLQLLNAARTVAEGIGADVAAVWLGTGGADNADVLGANGATKLYTWDSEDAHGYVTLPQVEALQQIIDNNDVAGLITSSSNHVKDVAARLAIRVDAGVITDATNLEIEDGKVVATKEVFGGDTITQCRVAEGKFPIWTIGANAFPVEESGGGAAEVVSIDVSLSEAAQKSKVTSVEIQSGGDRPDIGEAAIVVSGGRGLGDEEGFRLMEELADTLGAGVGASRAATDAGWYPHRFQIGQTGRTISPSLYIASGISGAIQHRAGMQTAQHIVAVNKDAEAPIFSIVDFGIVGDLYDVVPKLVEEIKSRKG
ncbi:MAG: electron transfer flavoprotein subunit alpha/FixB family protein [Actinobacteria bacterium]|nr:electron transfer flavoprotein subunit alpha/FixB family protein [Actinomycetota bacterium]